MPRPRTARIQEALERLKAAGVFRQADAVAAGISQPTLSRLAAAGDLVGLGDGFYYHPAATAIDPSTLQWIVACAHFGPKALIGGLTALFHYQLIPQVPTQIWVVVPPERKSSKALYRCLRSTHDPKVGVEEHGIYRIATVERSIVEAFVYQTKVGLGTALSAARRALGQNLTTETKLFETADALGAWKRVSPYWEAIRDDRYD